MLNVRVCAAALAACLIQLTSGMFIAWAPSNVPKLLANDWPDKITLEAASWVASLLEVGAVFGAIAAMFMANIAGRKTALILTIIPTLTSWAVMAWAVRMQVLCVARLIGGVSYGAISTIVPIYLTEIAPPTIRGGLTICFLLMNYLGILLGHAIGSAYSIEMYSYVAAALSVFQVGIFLWFPETPYYLMLRKRYAAAIDSLTCLRGTTDVNEEIDFILKCIQGEGLKNAGTLSNLRHLMLRPDGKRALITSTIVMLIQAFSGATILLNYTEVIFDSIQGSSLKATYLSNISIALYIFSYFICILLVDRLGRKPLIIISTAGVGKSTFILGLYLCLRHFDYDVSDLHWLPITGMLLYVGTVSLGVSSVPFLVASETFSTSTRAAGVGFCSAFNHAVVFLLSDVWMNSSDMINGFPLYWIIMIASVVGIFFVAFSVPETKHKVLEEFQFNVANGEK